MPITVNDCGGNTARVQAAARAACANLAVITDATLRACIQLRCNNGTIECEDDCDDGVLGYVYQIRIFGFTFFKFKTVHLCINNIVRASIADIILHEFAHTCCWEHFDGQGVPGNNGTIPN